MRTLALTFRPVAARPTIGRGAQPSIIGRIATWLRVAGERRRLTELEPRLLADMGLTAEQAAREASRPFWDVGDGR